MAPLLYNYTQFGEYIHVAEIQMLFFMSNGKHSERLRHTVYSERTGRIMLDFVIMDNGERASPLTPPFPKRLC